MAASAPEAPIGFWITLIWAIASSFDGTAGLFNVVCRPARSGEGAPFHVARSYPLLVAGVAMTLAFAWVLGPTIALH